MIVSSPPMQPGSLLTPHLRLERKLAQGAGGSVWVATHCVLGSQVAVKVLDSKEVSLSRREATLVARIRSPHIAQVHDVLTTEAGISLIVMELLEGEDLAERLKREGTLPLPRVLDLVEQVCRGLARVHAAKIVHRDLKPSNLFLVANGDAAPFIKILDFGIAKDFSDRGFTLTPDQSAIGTPAYMSPEQILTSREVDARADLWSLAVIVYQLVTGRLPFSGETIGARWLAASQGRFERASALNPALPKALDAWFVQALAVDREERFSSVDAFAVALRHALQGEVRGTQVTNVEKGHMVPPPVQADENTLVEHSHASKAQDAKLRWWTVLVVLPALVGVFALRAAPQGTHRRLIRQNVDESRSLRPTASGTSVLLPAIPSARPPTIRSSPKAVDPLGPDRGF